MISLHDNVSAYDADFECDSALIDSLPTLQKLLGADLAAHACVFLGNIKPTLQNSSYAALMLFLNVILSIL